MSVARYTDANKELYEKFAFVLMNTGGDFHEMRQIFAQHSVMLKEFSLNEMRGYNLKYSTLCPFMEKWQYASRGTTFIVSGKTKIEEATFAFNKFFNVHEFTRYKNKTFDEFIADSETDGFALVNKADGSLIRTWYSKPTGQIISTTLGTLDRKNTMSKLPGSPTFWDQSLEILQKKYPQIIKYLKENPGTMLLSELLTEHNRIVTYYKNSDIIPFVMVGTDGIPRWSILRQLVPEIFSKETGLPIKAMSTSKDTIHEDIKKFFLKIESNSENYGVCPEGLCVYEYSLGKDGFPDIAIPIAKAKREEYCERHKDISLNPGSPKDLKLMQIYRLEGRYDDISGIGKEARDKHIQKFDKVIHEIISILNKHTDFFIDAKNNIKKWASVVRLIPIKFKWIYSALYSIREKWDSSSWNPSGFVISYLLSTSCNGKKVISNLQKKYGVEWWEMIEKTQTRVQTRTAGRDVPLKEAKKKIYRNMSSKKFLVVCDFDGSFVENKGGDIKELKVIQKSVNVLKGYFTMGAHICFVTGRTSEYKKNIETFVFKNLGFRADIHIRPDDKSIRCHKTQSVVNIFNEGDYGTVVHIEDEAYILNTVSKAVNAITKNEMPRDRVRYIGIHVVDGIFNKVISSSKKACVITLVQPPASGKSAILETLEKRYLEQGHSVVFISPDRITNKWREANPNAKTLEGEWKKVPPDFMYKGIIGAYHQGVARGSVVIIDMCNDKSDLLKLIFKSDVFHKIVTFSPVIDSKNRKGKKIKVMKPEYVDFITANATVRNESKSPSSSTLIGIGSDKLKQVMSRKIAGCTHQIVTRDVINLSGDGKIQSLEEMISTMIALCDPMVNSATSDTSGFYGYIGIPVKVPPQETPDGFYTVAHPHITIVPPSRSIYHNLNLIGNKVCFSMSSNTHFVNTYGHHVITDKGNSTLHITRFVKKNYRPFHCKKECDNATSNGSIINSSYTKDFGFMLFM